MTSRVAPRQGAPYILLAIVFAGALAAGCDIEVGDKGVSFDIAKGKATDEWVRNYTVRPGGRVDVSNLNGAITVEPSMDAKVLIRAVREARAGSDDAARQLLAQTKMIEDAAPDHVRVDVDRPKGGPGFGKSISVRYTVQVPEGLTVSVRTENGGVELDGVGGALTAESTNGGITGRDLPGGVTATTVNGGVLLSLKQVAGDVSASTVNGGIRIEVPADANAQIDATVVNGGVSVDDALKLSGGQQDRRHVSGTLNAGGPKISAQTTNGGVRIYSSGRDTRVLRRR